MKVVIVGAGVGGLTLGILLRRAGHTVQILEKRTALGSEGAGVVLGPNVLGALGLYGLDAPIREAGWQVTAMNITDQRGRVLTRSEYQVPEPPLRGVAIHRTLLQDALRTEFTGELSLGAHVSEVTCGTQPSAFVNGESVTADLIVGADGIRSVVRRALAPEFETRYSGYTCFRFVVDEVWTDEVYEMWGRGKRVGIVPLGRKQSYVFLTLNSPRRLARSFASREAFAALWSEFAEPANSAFRALKAMDGVLHNDLEDGLAPRFHGQSTVLLGDAAHAVTPNMGQGAGLAIEDACCLAHLLCERGLSESTLVEYESLRRPRAKWILEQSFSLGTIAQLENPWLRSLRNVTLRLTPPSLSNRALRRIVTDMPGVPSVKLARQ